MYRSNAGLQNYASTQTLKKQGAVSVVGFDPVEELTWAGTEDVSHFRDVLV